jgi:hypothetical protein
MKVLAFLLLITMWVFPHEKPVNKTEVVLTGGCGFDFTDLKINRILKDSLDFSFRLKTSGMVPKFSYIPYVHVWLGEGNRLIDRKIEIYGGNFTNAKEGKVRMTVKVNPSKYKVLIVGFEKLTTEQIRKFKAAYPETIFQCSFNPNTKNIPLEISKD